MPHLAPLGWATAPLLFIFLLLLIVSTLWWTPSISHPSISSSYKSSSNSWNWK